MIYYIVLYEGWDCMVDELDKHLYEDMERSEPQSTKASDAGEFGWNTHQSHSYLPSFLSKYTSINPSLQAHNLY